MFCDMHVHTDFSCDSDAEMKKYCSVAKQKKIDVICFTDHVDFNANDEDYGYYDAVRFFEDFNEIKSKTDVKLLSGIEFSEPHLYNEQLKKLGRYPYDFIIGSVHYVKGMLPYSQEARKYSTEEFFNLYWQEVLESVESGGFDCLGHMDYPKKHYKELIYDEPTITKIFDVMIEMDIVPEINTSSLRKGLMDTMPGLDLLKLYKKRGGKYVTIGSDCHTEKNLGEGIEQAKKLMDEVGLKQVIFKKRKMEII